MRARASMKESDVCLGEPGLTFCSVHLKRGSVLTLLLPRAFFLCILSFNLPCHCTEFEMLKDRTIKINKSHAAVFVNV